MTIRDQTTQFLSRVMAWPQKGDAPSYINIHYKIVASDPAKARNDDGTLWLGRAGEHLREMTDIVFNLTSSTYNVGKVRDIYFCTSTQAVFKPMVFKKSGRPYKAASRHASTAVRLKSIFLDIDLNAGKKDKSKGYETPNELLAAFGKFLKDTLLPFPTAVVFTGGGYHMYWILDTPLPPNEWQVLADALAEATRVHGLKCDTQCTVDPARILRVPGTKNYKYDPPVPVVLMNILDHDYLFEAIDTPLTPYKVTRTRRISAEGMELFPRRPGLQGQSDLAMGVNNAPPPVLDELALGCEFIREAIMTGGAEYSEPQWNYTTLIGVFTAGGVDDAKRMAEGYPDYEEWRTEQKFDEKLQQGAKPPMCATISNVYKGCQNCPYLAAGRSPVNLATLIARDHQTQPATSPVSTSTHSGFGPTQQSSPVPFTDLPPGYSRHPDTGYILLHEEQSGGIISSIPICHYQMDLGFLTEDPPTLNFQTTIQINTPPRLIKVPCSSIGSNTFRGILQGQGMMVYGSPQAINKVGNFMSAWIMKLQKTPNSVVTPTPFGWKKTGNKLEGFVFGGVLHTPNGPAKATPGDHRLAEWYAPTGDRMSWISAAQMITAQKRMSLNSILVSGLAGPLFCMTGHSGALLAAYSPESGVGKTSAMKVAQAIWANPAKAMHQLSDTNQSVMHKMGELKNIPIFYDELRPSSDPKEFQNLVYQITGGKSRGRLTQNIEQREVGTWQTMMVSSSNQSFTNFLSGSDRGTAAGIYRMFEFLVNPMDANCPGRLNMADAQSIIGSLNDNYGVIGLEYAKFLGNDPDAVEKRVKHVYKQISLNMKIRDEERFWAAVVASMLVATEYGNKLGFFKIDIPEMMNFLRLRLEDLRTVTHQHSANVSVNDTLVESLSLFLNDKAIEHTLVTNLVYKLPGKPAVGHVTFPKGVSQRLREIHVHRGIDDKTLRIGREYLVDWLTKRHQNPTAFIAELTRKFQAVSIRSKLGTGTDYRTGEMYLIEFDTTNYPELQIGE